MFGASIHVRMLLVEVVVIVQYLRRHAISQRYTVAVDIGGI